MANTVIGWGPTEANPDGTVTEVEIARIYVALGHDQIVTEGLVATPGPGTRQVSVNEGTAWVAGTLIDVEATTVTLDAHAGGSSRHDWIVLEVDWPNKTALVKPKKGSSPVLPDLTQNPGAFWEMPIASVPVTSAHTAAFPGSVITARKPLPKKTRLFRGTGWETRNYLRTVSGGSVSSTPTIPDPGYPYRLIVDFEAHLAAHDGRVSLTASLYGQTIGAPSLSDTFQPNEENVQTINGSGVSGVLTNPAVVDLTITGHSITEGQIALQNIGYSHLTVLQIPA